MIKKYKEFIKENKKIPDVVLPVVELSKKLENLYYFDSLDFQDTFIIFLNDHIQRDKIKYIYNYDKKEWNIIKYRTTPTGRYGHIAMKPFNPSSEQVIKHIKKWIKKSVPQ